MTPASGGGYLQTQSFSGFGNPKSVAVDGSGNVYVGCTALGLVKETFSGGTYSKSTLLLGGIVRWARRISRGRPARLTSA